MAFVNYIELAQSDDTAVNNLLTLYRKNPHHARVIFYNDNDTVNKLRLIAYLRDDDTFEIALYEKKWGISKTNRIYNREKKLMSIYKSKNGYFYKTKTLLRPLTLKFINTLVYRREIIVFLTPYLPFLELMDKYTLLEHRTINYIIEHKITSLKKMLTFDYRLPFPVIKKIMNLPRWNGKQSDFKFNTYQCREYIDNFENINTEIFDKHANYQIFIDLISMARTLGYRVNASWSIKRMKIEHDKYAEILTDITFTVKDRPLNIGQEYLDFAEFSGYHIIKGTKELALESQRQKHCVASYAEKVDYKRCGIYHVNGYTLELAIENAVLKMAQFRGFRNADAPEELENEVLGKLLEFNEKKGITPSSLKISIGEIFGEIDRMFEEI